MLESCLTFKSYFVAFALNFGGYKWIQHLPHCIEPMRYLIWVNQGWVRMTLPYLPQPPPGLATEFAGPTQNANAGPLGQRAGKNFHGKY